MKHLTVEEAYKLADWAVRVVCPVFMEYDDGVRMNFPIEAKQLRDLFPIKDRASAQSAIKTLHKEIIPRIAEYRDGMPTVPLRQAHWLCMAAMAIESGMALPTDYGSEGLRDLARYMKVPLSV
jgi:hypothetical protein